MMLVFEVKSSLRVKHCIYETLVLACWVREITGSSSPPCKHFLGLFLRGGLPDESRVENVATCNDFCGQGSCNIRSQSFITWCAKVASLNSVVASSIAVWASVQYVGNRHGH